MQNTQDSFVRLTWTTSGQIFNSTEPEDFHRNILGEIYIGTNSEKPSGRFEVSYLNLVGAVNNEIDLWSVFDLTAETSKFYEPLISEDGIFFKDIVHEITEINLDLTNLLILDRIEITANHRGSRMTPKIIRCIERAFGYGASIMALKAFPLQFESNLSNPKDPQWFSSMKMHRLEQQQNKAQTKLEHYYSSIGFNQLNSEGIMVMPIND